MLKKTLLFCLLLQSLYTLAQETDVEWFPVGARWEYQQRSFSSTTSCQVEVRKDTIIDARSCKVFKTNCAPDETTFYLCPEGDKVYRYADSTFHILYDFTAQPGDTITTWVPGAGIGGTFESKIHKEVVDSVGFVTLGGKEYRAYWTFDPFDLGSSFSFLPRPVVEKFGDLDFMLPQFIANVTFPLTFYEDSCTTLQFNCLPTLCQYELEERCDTITQLGNISLFKELQVYPIPAREHLFIKNLPAEVSHYSISNISGRQVKTGTITQTSADLDVSSFENGIYLLTLWSERSRITEKIIVHH